MKIKIGGQAFIDVTVPVLWGTRAVLQDKQGRLSVIDLSGTEPRIEVIGDQPAPGVQFTPVVEGFKILKNGHPLYKYNKEQRVITAIELRLPDIQITEDQIRIGSNIFRGNLVEGSAVGIAVDEEGIGMGAPLPGALAHLIVK